MKEVKNLFLKGGSLSDALSHFELREGQVELSNAINQAITDKQHLIAEAGTGIGKTFSYLLPAMQQKKHTFVSTATKHLQDQIFFKDIPTVEKVLNRKLSSCLLKGRSNYLCHERFFNLSSAGFKLTAKQLRKINSINDWLEKTNSGDLSEVSVFDDSDAGLLKGITSNTDNCLGSECDYFKKCFLQKAREKAKKSEIVIVNHSLLMADIVLKETGFAEILPDVEVLIIDEAHHLAKVASSAFAEQISSNQLSELARDTKKAYQESGIIKNDGTLLSALKQTDDFTKELDKFIKLPEKLATNMFDDSGQILLSKIKTKKKTYTAFKNLMKAFKSILDKLEELSKKDQELENINERAIILSNKIKTIFQSNAKETLEQSVALFYWSDKYFNASKTPVHLGNRFQEIMDCYSDSWIFVSATLTVNGDFSYYKQELGLSDDIKTLNAASPFDYENNSAYHILENLPDPRQDDFTNQLIEEVKPIIKAIKGRTFILFTSYKALNLAADLLEGSEFNLFVQGDLPKAQLIDSFIKSENAILLGTVSFWEGVDVQGEKLSCVIIDKIPFPSPKDPIISEQMKYFERQGKNSFAHCFIPHATTLLKQGVGRLIRSKTDKGILVLGDSRLKTKFYGKQLINSLPNSKQMNLNELFDFIKEI